MVNFVWAEVPVTRKMQFLQSVKYLVYEDWN